jgi:hypothetical protein
MGQVIKLNLMVLTILVALLLIAAIVINTPQAHAIAISVESSPAGQRFIKEVNIRSKPILKSSLETKDTFGSAGPTANL